MKGKILCKPTQVGGYVQVGWVKPSLTFMLSIPLVNKSCHFSRITILQQVKIAFYFLVQNKTEHLPINQSVELGFKRFLFPENLSF